MDAPPHLALGGEQLYDSIDRFFLVSTGEFSVTPAALAQIELEALKGHRWWSVPEIQAASTTETFVPRRLGELLPPIIAGDIPPQPIDTGA